MYRLSYFQEGSYLKNTNGDIYYSVNIFFPAYRNLQKHIFKKKQGASYEQKNSCWNIGIGTCRSDDA